MGQRGGRKAEEHQGRGDAAEQPSGAAPRPGARLHVSQQGVRVVSSCLQWRLTNDGLKWHAFGHSQEALEGVVRARLFVTGRGGRHGNPPCGYFRERPD